MNEQYASRFLASFLIFGVITVGFFGYALYEANQPAAHFQAEGTAPTSVAVQSAVTPIMDTTAADTGRQFPASLLVPPKANSQTKAKATAVVPSNTPIRTVPVTRAAPPPVDIPPASKYKDGTYSATGSYDSPGGYDQLGVSITIANDVVSSADVTPMARDRTSSRYQQMFVNGYKQYVVGRSVDSIQLDGVSGSSLTGQGFNDALAQIKTQAGA